MGTIANSAEELERICLSHVTVDLAEFVRVTRELRRLGWPEAATNAWRRWAKVLKIMGVYEVQGVYRYIDTPHPFVNMVDTYPVVQGEEVLKAYLDELEEERLASLRRASAPSGEGA